MRSSRRCASDGSPAAAARCGASSSGTLSASKKSLQAAEQKRADVARARRRWMREQGMFDPARLVFIDETSTNTAMVRLRGRCPRGTRLIDHVPHGHWKTITFIAGLRRRAMVAPFVLDGPMNTTSFMAYLKRCLIPTLKRGDIVMMDSLPVHKVAGVRELIEAVGARLRYLPKYSPDQPAAGFGLLLPPPEHAGRLRGALGPARRPRRPRWPCRAPARRRR